MSLNMSSILGSSDLNKVYQDYSKNSLKPITDSYNNVVSSLGDDGEERTFDAVFQSALGMINETNDYTNAAEEEELNYAMGLSEDTHSLMIAQQKANVSLQYTVAVRDAVMDAYNEIMNMQF